MSEKLETIIIESIKTVLDEDMLINANDELRNIGLDSLKIVQLIIELEDELEMNFDDADLSLENFTSVNTIIELINRKRMVTAGE